MSPAYAREIAQEVLEESVKGIVGAFEREAARKRAEACAERLFHELLARSGRRIWRPWHRWMARRMRARCEANKLLRRGAGVYGCPAVTAMHRALSERGFA